MGHILSLYELQSYVSSGGVIYFENFAIHVSQIGNNKNIFEKQIKKIQVHFLKNVFPQMSLEVEPMVKILEIVHPPPLD